MKAAGGIFECQWSNGFTRAKGMIGVHRLLSSSREIDSSSFPERLELRDTDSHPGTGVVLATERYAWIADDYSVSGIQWDASCCILDLHLSPVK